MEHKDYPVDILDQDGRVVAQKPRYAVQKGRDIYNGVQVLIITPRSELVLSNIPDRQDLPNIYHRLLSTTVAAIRRSNETSVQAAKRALRRELLIKPPELTLLGDEMTKLVDGRRERVSAYYAIAEPPTEFSTVDIEKLAGNAGAEVPGDPEVQPGPFCAHVTQDMGTLGQSAAAGVGAGAKR